MYLGSQVLFQASFLTVLHDKEDLATRAVSAHAIHGQDVIVRIDEQVLVESTLVSKGGLVNTVLAVALHSDTDVTLGCPYLQAHNPK
jgi:hypothetical protein